MSSKKEQRKIATAARRAMTQEMRDEKSRMVSEHLIRLLERPEYSHVRNVLSYRATWDEVDVDVFNGWAKDRGMRVAFPISLPHGIMKAAVPNHEGAWHQGAYDIWEPVEAESEILAPGDFDIIIVPCVAFDRQGRRLGHGAGYYDRYMAGLKSEVPVMVAFDAQELDEIVTEETDLPIKVVVTESGEAGDPEKETGDGVVSPSK